MMAILIMGCGKYEPCYDGYSSRKDL